MKTFHGFISSENTSENDCQAIKNSSFRTFCDLYTCIVRKCRYSYPLLPAAEQRGWGSSVYPFQHNKPLLCFVFPTEVPGELDSLSFHKLCVDMHVNKTKFERKGSLEYYHVTCIEKTKHAVDSR